MLRTSVAVRRTSQAPSCAIRVLPARYPAVNSCIGSAAAPGMHREGSAGQVVRYKWQQAAVGQGWVWISLQRRKVMVAQIGAEEPSCLRYYF
jgi:hypothetical protein